ncbi:MAG: hypothetical protein E7Z91_01440 [Cyanobacteria bacterium SIG30]|nr:hypothetical protein [Cyanobacteria bacterium SIG30]
MQKMLTKPINLILIIIFLAVLCGGGYLSVTNVQKFIVTYNAQQESSAKLVELEEKLALIKEERANKPVNEVKTDKEIFKALDSGIGPDAAYAPLFEKFIDLAKMSGIRIRSIEYSDNPADDRLVSAQLTYLNVKQLKVKAVGSYRNFQTFFRAITKEHYLMSISQMEFQPWENDRSVLISEFFLRLYTKNR